MSKSKRLSLKFQIALLAALDWLLIKTAQGFSGISLSLLSLSNRAFDRKVYLRQAIEDSLRLAQDMLRLEDLNFPSYSIPTSVYQPYADFSQYQTKDGPFGIVKLRAKREPTKPKSKKRTSKSKKGKSKWPSLNLLPFASHLCYMSHLSLSYII